MALTDKLTAIANAIRAKTGGTALLTLAEMPTAIAGISGGGGVASGSFTPSAQTDPNGYEIELGQTCSNIIIRGQETATQRGYRCLRQILYVPDVNLRNSTGSNTAGTSETSAGVSDGAISFTGTKATLVTISTVSNGGGYFAPMEYKWVAW